MDGVNLHRMAALRVAGLSAADRKWVFSRLAPSEQAILGKYLKELERINASGKLPFSDVMDALTGLEPSSDERNGSGGSEAKDTVSSRLANALARMSDLDLVATLEPLSPRFLSLALAGQLKARTRYLNACANARSSEVGGLLAALPEALPKAISEHAQRILLNYLVVNEAPES